MVGGGEFGGEECALEPGEGLMPNFAAGIDPLGAERAEDGRPVSYPRWSGVSNNRISMAIETYLLSFRDETARSELVLYC